VGLAVPCGWTHAVRPNPGWAVRARTPPVGIGARRRLTATVATLTRGAVKMPGQARRFAATAGVAVIAATLSGCATPAGSNDANDRSISAGVVLSKVPTIVLVANDGVEVSGRVLEYADLLPLLGQDQLGISAATSGAPSSGTIWWRGSACYPTTVFVGVSSDGLEVSVRPDPPAIDAEPSSPPVECPAMESVFGVDLLSGTPPKEIAGMRLLDSAGALVGQTDRG
jgi:hypothetical protein